MPSLTLDALRDPGWAAAGIQLPQYDVEAVHAATRANPVWVHFGGGNIFRGFVAMLQQGLLDKGLSDRGILVGETFDPEVIDRVYKPHDNLAVVVGLKADGNLTLAVCASVAGAYVAWPGRPDEYAALKAAFENPSLQMVSFTITEKGYAMRGLDGEYLPWVKADLDGAPGDARSAMGVLTALLLARYHKIAETNAGNLAVVSMDNCSHNGEKLQTAVLETARAWASKGHVPDGFLAWLEDASRVAFPWTMIDKITPSPARAVQTLLEEKGVLGMEPIHTAKHTDIAPFVNMELPQYLVIEDAFPNGRPPLEHAGVIFTDRATVNKVERMKVTTCLNPLHTAMAPFGCLLNFPTIAASMKDPDIVALVKRLGYDEGLPVVTHPGVLDPKAFIDEVVEQRLPNPFLPDTPQRIMVDTSQKVAIRFGETVKAYASDPARDPKTLAALPLAIAGWMRYLLGVDDQGNPIALSADPMLDELTGLLQGVRFGDPDSLGSTLRPILSNANLFGLDLYEAGIGGQIEQDAKAMLEGKGAVRKTLHGRVG